MSLETKNSNLDTKTTDSIERSVKLQDQFHKIVKQLWLYPILASKWILLIFPYLLHPFRQVPISWVGDADSTTSSTTASLLPITLWVHRLLGFSLVWLAGSPSLHVKLQWHHSYHGLQPLEAPISWEWPLSSSLKRQSLLSSRRFLVNSHFKRT